ncbi:uncharacterized protein T551_02033 [Pneumocystis jirovecii RU7]|uniref:RRM domain-containing protein n=1 Tax=Pneumocystis jirovecii (strain RU7) TaxID=1408657 RepID=A0A0W4ZNY5_PNEJ7|nr:uncharacterized protein T551_02033 [Pneumocystis jirovecii RU7]KTW30089.1 hypothetical protein T551_02033 [Pneumocystis jirovecii RU7]
MGPKRNKGEKLSLSDFLSGSNWADEMEDMPIAPLFDRKETKTNYYDRNFSDKNYGKDRDQLYKLDRSVSREQIPLPKEPPYTAHLGNLSFNITESEITDFFGEPFVTNIRLMRDQIDDRPKGFGYVEFTDLQALINAISLNGKTLSGRAIKISVAEPPRKGHVDRDPVEDRTAGEWRRSSPLPPIETVHEKRSTYERRNCSGNNDRTYSSSDNNRDFSNWERKGPLQDLPGSDLSTEKHDYRNTDWRSGERYRNSGFGDRNYGNNNNYNTLRTSSIGERPKLVLKPRGETPEEPSQIPKTSTKPNPFGDARPVDSNARIREIEEKEQKKKEKKQAAENQKAFGREKAQREMYRFDKLSRKEKNRRNASLDRKNQKVEKKQVNVVNTKQNSSKIHSGDSSKSTDSISITEAEADVDGWSTVNKLSKKR